MSESLIKALQNQQLFDHSVDQFDLVETHISWVILTGSYAYKIKKPHNFGFLDFSTLDKRQHFCQEELRLNQRLAPNLYLGVIPITGSATSPTLKGDGPIIEYAVKMRQFDQQHLLDRVLKRGELTTGHINAIAEKVAEFHQTAEHAPTESRFGRADETLKPVVQNFEQIRPFLTDAADITLLDQIETWALATHQRLQEQLDQRKALGFIRECHGDLHLGNITLIDNEITLFDCIEFNQDFSVIDVVSEIAFFAMDLEARELPAFANIFVNRYFELSGDYQGLALLDYYKSYRALVRAKVALFRLHDASETEREQIFQEYRLYAELARQYMQPSPCFMLMMHGYSGTGKSSVSDQLIARLGAIRLRSDVLRKQLYAEKSPQADDSALYSQAISDETFNQMAAHAETILEHGYPVIADATFLKSTYREKLTAAAERQGVAMQIINCLLPDEHIRSRLEKRQQMGSDASDADVSIYELQLQSSDPLSEAELNRTLEVNTIEASGVATFVEELAARIL